MSAFNIFGRFAALALAAVLFTSPAAAADVIYTGTFKGAGGKKSSGNFEIFKKGGKTFITLKSNFRLSSVPDPKLAFGGSKYQKGTIYTGKLKKNNGKQTYEIPARLDPSKFKRVWIWCEKFSVPLASAVIKKK